MFHTRCHSERITLFQLKYFILNVELHAPIYYLNEHVGISHMCGNLKSLVYCHKERKPAMVLHDNLLRYGAVSVWNSVF